MSDALINAEALRQQLHDPRWRPVDCRFDLAAPAYGAAAFARGHLPGAVYAHLDDDLSGPVTATSGRHPLPGPAALAQRLAAWGIRSEEHTPELHTLIRSSYADFSLTKTNQQN